MITVEMLEDAGACEDQVELFREHFPNGTEVTEEIAVSMATEFDWYWAAYNFLTDEGAEKWENASEQATEEYRNALFGVPWDDRETRDAATLTYHKAEAAAWARIWLDEHKTDVAE